MRYATPVGDASAPDFSAQVLRQSPLSDDALADLIDSDGRERLRLGLECSLDRYLHATPRVLVSPVALDSAIDVSLRSLALRDGLRTPAEQHVEALCRLYPALSDSIRVAGLLSRSLLTTGGFRARRGARTAPTLPTSIGPMIAMPDGELDEGTEQGRRYLLTRLIGAGASGAVYEAVDRLLSEDGHPARVAVKLIAAEAGDPLQMLRHTEEATKARRINHPNVVRVLDRGAIENDTAYVVSEFVDGGDLQARLDAHQGPLPAREAARLMAAIADGVQAAHAIGLLHSDLKPSNIVLTGDNTPKVADFGLALAWDQDPVSIPPSALDTQDDLGSVAGNLAYISPEQFRGQRSAISPASDVYALAGILFHLLTRTFPNGATPREVAERHSRSRDQVEPLRFPEGPGTSPGIDRRLVSICLRALSPEPSARHANAGELAADLRAWLDHRPVAWMRPSAASRLRLSARRSPWLAALAAITVAVSLGGTFTAGYYAKSASAARREKTEAKDKTLDLIRNAYRNLGAAGSDGQPKKADTARRQLDDLSEKVDSVDKPSSDAE